MAIYTIHAPPLVGNPALAFDRARVLKTGFSRAALVFGPLWLALHRLWIPLAAWIAAAAAAYGLYYANLVGLAGIAALYLVAAVWIGVEGRGWLSASLERAGLPLVDVVEARGDDEAARVFLNRAPIAPAPAAPAPPPAHEIGVIGSFPQAQRR